MKPIEEMQDAQNRLLGFAMAVRDLHQINMAMPHERMIELIVQYVEDYEIARKKHRASAN
jgi:hypothetical protein